MQFLLKDFRVIKIILIKICKNIFYINHKKVTENNILKHKYKKYFHEQSFLKIDYQLLHQNELFIYRMLRNKIFEPLLHS